MLNFVTVVSGYPEKKDIPDESPVYLGTAGVPLLRLRQDNRH